MKPAWLVMAALALAPQFSFADSILPASNDEADLSDMMDPSALESEMASDEYVEEDVVPTASTVRLRVVVSKKEQRLYVYEDGRLTGSWLVSTGLEKKKCPPSGKCYVANTPNGTFTPTRLHHTYTSKLWNARMDRAIFFTGGIALHATYGDNIALLGTKASGGCVRQHPDNADKLFRLVKFYGASNTRITVQP